MSFRLIASLSARLAAHGARAARVTLGLLPPGPGRLSAFIGTAHASARDMKPIAILYATREGHTRRIATRLVEALSSAGYASELRDVAKLGEAPNFGQFSAVLLAASVHVGRHEREMTELVKRHRAALERLPTAFISVSLAEAGAEDDSKPQEQRARAVSAVKEVIDRFVQETGWHPDRIKPVAGALPYTHYNPFVRLVMRLIAGREGGDTDTSRDYEYTNWDELVAFAQSFAADVEALQEGACECEAGQGL